ncbi:MAG: GH92 family glycosyl hydrolase [Pyrinomonadaceae bacterium]
MGCKLEQIFKLVAVRKAGLPPPVLLTMKNNVQKGGIIFFLILLSAFCLLPTANAQPRDFTRWVNPFIGTGGHGHTFPGATMPFGMVQLSPDTRIDNWDGSSGYHYSDDVIYGFSHTHLSGTGIPDGCDILLMPLLETAFEAKAGDKTVNGYASKFSHANEKAEPGYYSVILDDDKTRAELTSTERVGFHRYTYPASDDTKILLDLKWRDRVHDSEVRRVGDRRLEGFRTSTSWAKDQKVYFVVEFSKPIRHGVFGSGNRFESLGWKGTDVKGLLFFGPSKRGEQISVKVAISYVSIEGARKNLEAELPGWDFDKVRADAKAAWNKELSKIEVSGGTDDQTTTFYTALYHTMIHPNVFNDVDGQYKGHDGKIHQLRGADTPVRMSVASTRTSANQSKSSSGSKSFAGGTGDADKSVRAPSEQYTVFSLWDTFRAAHPLYTIIDQKRTVDFINTFIRIYEQGGRLPVWELWGEETDTMIGYHAVSVIADAMAKGIKGFDYEKAYAAAKHSANLDHFGLAAYKKRGYISMEDENESVSKTLEYAYDDWCMSVIARRMMARRSFELFSSGASDAELNTDAKFRDYENTWKQHLRRSYNFENLFDPQTGFFRPKRNGGFVSPFLPNEVTFHYTEANAWQYAFFVPHDIERLITLMGGHEKFAAKLDELFTTNQKLAGREQPDITGLIGQYAHGNEPSHHIPYLYSYVGQSRKTQGSVRQIMSQFYKNAPDGLIGNEDCGQMSAWYVMSALGLYQVLPGSEQYVLGSPLFKRAVIKLENGKSFVISAPLNSPKNIYVRSRRINGKPWGPGAIFHTDLYAGGTLDVEMSLTPDPADLGFAFDIERVPLFVAVPTIEGIRVFKDKTTITLKAMSPNSRITYTTDNFGEEFARKTQTYTDPFTIDETTKVEAYATDIKTGAESMKVEAVFSKRSNDWTVKVISGYSTQYTGGSDDAIVDGIRGTVNFASGEWQGVQGKPYEAVIDLRRETEIKELGGSFLQVAGPWIWAPSKVEFEFSSDGKDFSKIGEVLSKTSVTDMQPKIVEYVLLLKDKNYKAHYVRVKAFNIGKIPSWHPGAGGDPWIFVDEIFIK